MKIFVSVVNVFLLVVGIELAAWAAVAADDKNVPEPFRGENAASTLSISYDDISRILKQTVLETGRSSRVDVSRPKPAAGSRIIRGDTKKTRLEGNRFDFFALDDANLDTLLALRRDLEKVPSVLPLHELSRDEQLAYWLNLYNITVIEQIGRIFPQTNLKKKYFGTRSKSSIWDRKVLNVAGIALSLNDIQHSIIIPKFKDPLVMYGLFQGVVGSPNVRAEAYTGKTVIKQLKKNAKEFINSNRGARMRERIIQVSYFYEVNAALFPNFDRDLKHHIYDYASNHFRDKIAKASPRIRATTVNWRVADLYGGNRSLGSAVSTNGGALLGAFETGNGFGDYGGESGGAIASQWVANTQSKNQYGGRFPIHVVEYLEKVHMKNRNQRTGNVEIEEYTDQPEDRIVDKDKTPEKKPDVN